MNGLVPRALGDSVRPRRLSGVVGRPLNFTVRRPRQSVSHQYRTQIERWGAPARVRWILLATLVLVLVGNLCVIIYVSLRNSGGAPKGLLYALWALALVAALLIARLFKAMSRTASTSSGSNG